MINYYDSVSDIYTYASDISLHYSNIFEKIYINMLMDTHRQTQNALVK